MVDKATSEAVFGPGGDAWFREFNRMEAFATQVRDGAAQPRDEHERLLMREIAGLRAMLSRDRKMADDGQYMLLTGKDTADVLTHIRLKTEELRAYRSARGTAAE